MNTNLNMRKTGYEAMRIMNILRKPVPAPIAVLFSLFLIIGGFTPFPAIAAEPLLQQQSDDIFIQLRNGKHWQTARSRKLTNPAEVKAYLEELNQSGYSDWRLPTKSELSRLFDIFDVKRNGDVAVKLEGFYWIADDGGEPYQAAWKRGDG